MANLVHKTTGHSRPIKSSPSKDKPYYTVICSDGKLENIEEHNVNGPYSSYTVEASHKTNLRR